MQNKKQLFQLVSDIAHLNNTAWGNHAGSYDDAVESTYQIEEALEGLNNLPCLVERLQDDNFEPIMCTPKAVSRAIIALANDIPGPTVPDVDRFDKALSALQYKVNTAKGKDNHKELFDIIKM